MQTSGPGLNIVVSLKRTVNFINSLNGPCWLRVVYWIHFTWKPCSNIINNTCIVCFFLFSFRYMTKLIKRFPQTTNCDNWNIERSGSLGHYKLIFFECKTFYESCLWLMIAAWQQVGRMKWKEQVLEYRWLWNHFTSSFIRFHATCIHSTPFAVHLRKIYIHLRQQLKL